jgi:hypothetical protein
MEAYSLAELDDSLDLASAGQLSSSATDPNEISIDD